MSGPSKLKVWVEDGVGVVAIDSGKRNQLSVDLLTQLASSLLVANGDKNVRWVALTATGMDFFTGGIDWGLASADYDYISLLAGSLRSLVSVMMALEKPVVTVLNGSVAGNGIDLMMFSDAVIAPPDIRVCYPEGSLGLRLLFSTDELARRMPRHEALRLLSGLQLSSTDLVRHGIAYLVSRENLFGEAKAFIRGISEGAVLHRSALKDAQAALDRAELEFKDSLLRKCGGAGLDRLRSAVDEMLSRCGPDSKKVRSA